MDYWIRDLSELSSFSVSTLTRWLKSGFLNGFLSKERKMMIKLNTDNILKVRKELRNIEFQVRETERLRDRKVTRSKAKYKPLERFAFLWGFEFNKEAFTLNGYEVIYRSYQRGDEKEFEGKRYFIDNIDVYLDFFKDRSFGEKSIIKEMLGYKDIK